MKIERLNYLVKHIPLGTPCNRRPGLALDPVYLTVHSTGNPTSTAQNEWGWLTNPANQRTASWHICVDEDEAVEAIPLGEVAWHAGDGGSGPGNRKSIAVEICESGDRARTLKNAAELIARLLQERGWGAERLRRHWDWSKKLCPRILMTDNWAPWEDFKGEIQKLLDGAPKPVGRKNQGDVPEPGGRGCPENNLKPGAQGCPGGNPKATAQNDHGSVPVTLPQIQRPVAGTLDGLPVEFGAYLINNCTYVPLRPLARALGLGLEWREEQYHITTVDSPPGTP